MNRHIVENQYRKSLSPKESRVLFDLSFRGAAMFTRVVVE